MRLVLLIGTELRYLELRWAVLGRQVLPYAVATLAALVGCAGSWFGWTMSWWMAIPAALLGLMVFVVLLRVLRVGLTQQDARAIQGSLPQPVRGATGWGLRLLSVIDGEDSPSEVPVE
ncbi:hypothetical protein SDC9_136213 [bioreactor metagenome]|uniref:Uncharacterized protein n=1 Tax=bioreactor metagenome TaxID=1076179 RepID=A0A645DIP1_9ZZZZ